MGAEGLGSLAAPARRKSMRSSRTLVLAATVALAGAFPAFAQVVLTGGELPAVTNLTGQQHLPTAALFPGGGLLAWEDESLGVLARSVDPLGNPRGGVFALAANDA